LTAPLRHLRLDSVCGPAVSWANGEAVPGLDPHDKGSPRFRGTLSTGWLVMAVRGSFDVVVVGGGIAGSVVAGVLARSGVRMLVAEKESRFRDRIRGESTYPWGMAEAARLGAGAVFEQAGAVDLAGTRVY